MAHNRTEEKTRNPLRRAAAAVSRAVSRITHRGNDHGGDDVVMPLETQQEITPRTTAPAPSRAPRREADVPMDITNEYTPKQTSLKGGFRDDGSARQRDQELAAGAAPDERWNDEDRFTNKSGDPRIGTRGRTYEPGETRK
jgi:hypothetical protein